MNLDQFVGLSIRCVVCMYSLGCCMVGCRFDWDLKQIIVVGPVQAPGL